jgi:hypothetical protein
MSTLCLQMMTLECEGAFWCLGHLYIVLSPMSHCNVLIMSLCFSQITAAAPTRLHIRGKLSVVMSFFIQSYELFLVTWY